MSLAQQHQGSHCRSCGGEIVWAVTTSGKLMPVDAQPHPLGTIKLDLQSDGTLLVLIRGGDHEASPRYRAHFATCPDAESWRRR